MILGKPNTKCPHGVFLAGEAKARYCSFCNPDLTAAQNVGVSGGVDEIEEESEAVFAEDDCGALDLALPIPQAGQD